MKKWFPTTTLRPTYDYWEVHQNGVQLLSLQAREP
jgi:hypothetical protein